MASGMCVLVCVLAGGGVRRGGLVPFRLVGGLSSIFLVGLQGFMVLEQKDGPRHL